MKQGFRIDRVSVQRVRTNIDRGIQVDMEDLDLLLMCKWSIYKGYAYGYSKPFGGQSKLHRIIMERMLGRKPLKAETVDHINGNGLDNRRGNLRIATQSQNCANTKLSKRNTTGFKGVSCSKPNQKWTAGIRANGRQIHLGTFTSPESAHEAYKAAAIKYRGEFARFE